MHSTTNIGTHAINKTHYIVNRIYVATISLQLINEGTESGDILLHNPSLVDMEKLANQQLMLILTKAVHD
jgi:hypothetical protein